MVRLRFETDLATSLKAMADLQSATDKLGDKFEASAGEARKLELAAKRIVDQNLTPLERYNQKLDTLAKSTKAGSLSMEDAERTAGRLRQRLDETASSSRGLFSPQALQSLQTYVTGMLSISGAVALIRSEFGAIRAEGERISRTQLGAADARDVLKRNIFGLPDAERQAVLNQATTLATRTSLPQQVIDTALAETISARGGNVREAVSFLEYATKFTRDPQNLSQFAGATGDIANALGITDPQQALGFLGIAAQKARPSDLAQVARNLPKVTQAVRGYGGDPTIGAGLFAGITVGAGDVTGEVSRTAGIKAAKEISKLAEASGGTFQSVVNRLFSDPTLAKQFVEDVGGEAAAPGVRALFLDPKSAARQAYESAVSAVGDPAAQAAAGARGVEFLGRGKLADTRLIEQTVQSRVEQFRLTQPAVLSEQSREEIIERAAQLTGAFRSIERFGIFLRTGSVLSPEEAIETLEGGLRQRRVRGDVSNPDLVKNTEAMISELRAINSRLQAPPQPVGAQE